LKRRCSLGSGTGARASAEVSGVVMRNKSALDFAIR
jgi:hypothetical protein